MIKFGNDRQLAYTTVRLALGLNILFHGVVRFGDNFGPFVNDTAASFQKAPIPTFVVRLFLYVLPVAEFFIGLLLTLGFRTRLAALAGSVLMLMLITGMTLLEEWDIVGIQMLYVLFYAIVLAFREHNAYSLDEKFWKKL